MKILVAGCSFSEHVGKIIEKKIPGSMTVNLSKGAAGNKYIADSIVTATSKDHYDLIYLNWTGFSRYDAVVNDLGLFKTWITKNTLFDKNYVFTGGIGGWDHHNHPFANLLFSGYHKLVDHEQLHYNSLLEILKTQGYLESLKIPFYVSMMINQFKSSPDVMTEHTCEYGTSRYKSNNYLIEKIKLQNWIFGPDQMGMYETAKSMDMLSKDNFHPSFVGYEYWINLFVDRLKKDKII